MWRDALTRSTPEPVNELEGIKSVVSIRKVRVQILVLTNLGMNYRIVILAAISSASAGNVKLSDGISDIEMKASHKNPSTVRRRLKINCRSPHLLVKCKEPHHKLKKERG